MLQLIGDQRRRSLFFEGEFRVGVDPSSDSDEVVFQFRRFI